MNSSVFTLWGLHPPCRPDFVTIPFISGIDPINPDRPTSFYTNSSRPSILHGIDQGSLGGLLDAIAVLVNRDLSVPVSARGNSVSTVIGDGVQEKIKGLVLVGASNMKAMVGLLQADGLEVIDLSVPGWCVSPKSMQSWETNWKLIIWFATLHLS